MSYWAKLKITVDRQLEQYALANKWNKKSIKRQAGDLKMMDCVGNLIKNILIERQPTLGENVASSSLSDRRNFRMSLFDIFIKYNRK